MHADKLPVMEHFLTLQGEGAHSGKAAYFIRLGGCTIGCHWCDVKESWNSEIHPYLTIHEIALTASASGAGMAVITGGEPTMYDLNLLTMELNKKGLRTHLETSGAYSVKGNFDWICLSPKKRMPPIEGNMALANELKIIIFNKDDFAWAERYAKKVSPACRLFLQPEWSKKEKVTPAIIKYILAHPKWQISLQTHKYLGIP